MNRRIQYANFLGIVALAALCVFQWQRDRKLNLEVNSLEKTRQEQQQKLSEQDITIGGLTEDLTHFKEQFSLTHSNLTEAREKLRKTESENDSLQREREQLHASITNWTQAVSARDARLTEANERIRSMAAQLNESIGKYNELATNYNAVVKQLEEARAKK